jgi:hypothetical protein
VGAPDELGVFSIKCIGVSVCQAVHRAFGAFIQMDAHASQAGISKIFKKIVYFAEWRH